MHCHKKPGLRSVFIGFRSTASFKSRDVSDGSFEARCAILVSYMLPQSQARESANFSILNSLLTLSVSPLPRPLGYLESYSPGYPEGNSGDYPGSYSGSYSESYPDSYSENYPEGYPPRYSESYPGSYRESYPEGCSPSCPENRSGDNPESNSGSNRESYSEDYPDSYPESFDPRPVNETTQVQRPDRKPD